MTTQAQVTALQNWYAAGAPLVAAITADNPTPPATLDSVTRYDGSFFGTKGFRVVGVSQNGIPYGKPRPVWGTDPTYTCTPAGSPMAKTGDVCGTSTWGTSTEYHRVPVATIAGQQWMTIDGYGPSGGLSAGFYPCEMIRCDWVNVNTGTMIDVTPPITNPPTPQGQPYLPALIPASGHFRMRTWGWIWSSMTGGRSSTFYWEGDFTFGQNITNPAWLGDSKTTRPAFTMSEGWWSNGAWVRATGTDPFSATNGPQVPVTTYLGYNVNAQDAATMWVYSYAPDVAGLESIHA